MKNQFNVKKLIKITVFVVVCSLVVAVGASFATGNGIFSFGSNLNMEKLNIDESKEHEISKIQKINIDVDSSDIKIILTKEDKVRAHFYGNYSSNSIKGVPHLEIKESGDALNIEIEHPKRILVFNINNSKYQLDVYIPEKYANNIKINSEFGDVNIDELKVNEFICNTDSGNVSIKSLDSNKSRFETSFGHVNIDQLKGNEFICNTDSGNVNIKSLHSKKSSFDSSFGNITVDNCLGEFNGKSDSGKYNVTFEKLQNDVNIETSFGNVKLKFPENPNFELDFRTSFGDFISDFPMNISGDICDKDVKGTVGKGGNKIKVETDSGDLEISN